MAPRVESRRGSGRVEADKALKAGRIALAGRGYLRAAEYWRQSYFFLRQNLNDERVIAAYRHQRDAFRSALPYPPAHVAPIEIPYEDTPISGYLFQPHDDPTSRPTVLLAGGFDSTAE